MRLWMVPPQTMCRQHLLGEHVECHMFLGAMLKNKNLYGYIEKGLFHPRCLQSRHSELAHEMVNRGHNHQSPLFVTEDMLKETEFTGLISLLDSWTELVGRCEECRERFVYTFGYNRPVDLLTDVGLEV